MAEHFAEHEAELYHETIVYIEKRQGDNADAVEQQSASWVCELCFGRPCWMTAAMLVLGSRCDSMGLGDQGAEVQADGPQA
ncbi:hypothetical protein LTR35_012441 [Friedmanniomyces endolithicus]|uniref:Uncharacterized protein n=1 Tax=Friedmanniomyces endolithicus TaxID=329885 RepID=A0AAN6J6E5_9PEZI|nr:hypothetical protein LTR35_012441 [Friedmanniomyces endolithicus]KAK0294593.1 hypothetical protein LTS00_006794 [Friedmanniomyces endolithicus]KAK0318192.1 hypothetical protein LTR82_010891 [Friedmanniomyces endolithicus]KAK1009800.1 hypothetical protein LTR54_005596 [Friedmanniomyces endolithicus]